MKIRLLWSRITGILDSRLFDFWLTVIHTLVSVILLFMSIIGGDYHSGFWLAIAGFVIEYVRLFNHYIDWVFKESPGEGGNANAKKN